MAIELINAKTKAGLDAAVSAGTVKATDLAFLSEEGFEVLRTQGKDFVFVPTGFEGSDQLFLQSDGTKPVWKSYTAPKEYKWYGVQWPTDSNDPHLERCGSFEYHQTLPVQSQLKACIVKTSPTAKTKQYDLDPENWNFRLNALEVRATGTVNYSDSVGSGTISVLKTAITDITIPNLESAVNRLKDHYITIDDKFGTSQPFIITAVAESADTTAWELTVHADLEESGVFTSPFTCHIGSDLSGYDGQVMVDVPTFYIQSETNVTTNNKKYNNVKISAENLGTGWTEVPARYDTAYKISVLNTVPENMGYLSTLAVNAAVSINNKSDYCRGGGNRTANDHYLTDDDGKMFMQSDLGKQRTNISRTNMRKYCRLSGLEILSYYEYKSLYWLWVIEYANFNSQEAFNPALTVAGLRQGGMGAGLTNMSNWDQFNTNYPIMPNGYLDDLASETGIKDLKIPSFKITTNEVNFSSVYSRYTHNYQATELDKVSTRNNVDYVVSNNNKTITFTAIRANGSAVGYLNSWGKGDAVFIVSGLTGTQTLVITAGSTSITFTAENQATPQTINLNGYTVVLDGFATTTDAGGHTIVDPEVGDTTSVALTCNSSVIEDITFPEQTVVPFKWRNYENLFGDTWNNLDGIVIDASSQSGGSYNSVYATKDPTLYCQNDGTEHDRTSVTQMTLAGKEIHLAGYTTEYDLGTEGNIFPIKHGGSTGSGMCDYHYVGSANDTLRTLLLGGAAKDGGGAGLGYFYSNYSVGFADAYIGFRASCSK